MNRRVSGSERARVLEVEDSDKGDEDGDVDGGLCSLLCPARCLCPMC